MFTKKKILALFLALVCLVGCLTGCSVEDFGQEISNSVYDETEPSIETTTPDNDLDPDAPVDGKEPAPPVENNGQSDVELEIDNATIKTDVELLAKNYTGQPYVAVNGNLPYFTDTEKQMTSAFELYSDLDSLGRVGVAYANLCKELMPNEPRESLSSVTPTAWHNKKYDFVDAKWVYNRAHIIGFQLAGEQANKLNLMTGTRYFNVQGMLPFENMVADYIRSTKNHVLYRVTPVFVGDNLLAEGVLMEAWSVEDNGDGICFNVFCYNVEPGVEFNYATGENWASDTPPIIDNTENEGTTNTEMKTYILNTNTKKFHKEDCGSAKTISEKNKEVFTGYRSDLIDDGYSPCGNCKP